MDRMAASFVTHLERKLNISGVFNIVLGSQAKGVGGHLSSHVARTLQ